MHRPLHFLCQRNQTANSMFMQRDTSPQTPRCDPSDLMVRMEAKLARADMFLRMKGYTVEYVHGQRISVNGWVVTPEVEKLTWNEIFIGKLPRDLFEDEFLPLLETCGTVYKIRSMMDFSKSNRGYCFVKYSTREAAFKAVRELDGRFVVLGKPPIGVKLSFDNKCLYFGNLPGGCTDEILLKALNRFGVEGIEAIQVAGQPKRFVINDDQLEPMANGRFSHQKQFNWNNQLNNKHINLFNLPNQTRRFGNRNYFVYFVSHDAATKARRLLVPGDFKLFHRRLTIDWAKSVIPEEILANLSCSLM